MEVLAVEQQLKDQGEIKDTLLIKVTDAEPNTLVLKTDQNYLEGYFNIGKLYQEKRLHLDQMKEADTQNQLPKRKYFKSSLRKPLKVTSRKRKVKPAVLQKKLLVLNEKIKTAEGIFWGSVDKARKEGVKFAFEVISDGFKLLAFEKRVLLFFYYLEYYDITRNVCMEDDVLCFFDLENSAFSRMMQFKYFNDKAALFENDLLLKVNRKSFESARMEISLSSRALTILSDGLNGEKQDIDLCGKEYQSDFNSVGYVKEPEYTLEDVLLKDDIKDKVKLFLDAFKENKLETIGIKERIKKGLGTVFLFHGPPGTGKSMLAEAIGKYVNKKILMVEYPKIMERWVGATDKNISNIFKVAKKDDLVVVLDEADTLFYNRAFAFQEHDIRFVNEMLQELERFDGMIILTTNMTELLDQALERRVSLKVKFENPTREARFKIWQSHLPKQLKLSEDVDFNYLSNKYDFSGGNIKNGVLNALRKLVSRNGDTLLMQDLIFGADMEKDGMYSSLHKEPIGFIAN